jgi:hypothetical protein
MKTWNLLILLRHIECDVGHEMTPPSQSPESWVRIPLGGFMSVMSCVGCGFAMGSSPIQGAIPIKFSESVNFELARAKNPNPSRYKKKNIRRRVETWRRSRPKDELGLVTYHVDRCPLHISRCRLSCHSPAPLNAS